jgi:hypothetical protein
VLGFPDEIWGTRTQLIDVGAVVIVSVLSASAATVIEKRQAPGVGRPSSRAVNAP